jgi:hypothetical protein
MAVCRDDGWPIDAPVAGSTGAKAVSCLLDLEFYSRNMDTKAMKIK